MIVIAVAYSSPWWLDWRLVLGGILLYYAQLLCVGGCVLNKAQFGDPKHSIHEWYLQKIGIHVERRKLRFVLDILMPPCFVVLALLVQTIFHHRPLVHPF